MSDADTRTEVFVWSSEDVCLWIPHSEGNTGQLKTQIVCVSLCICLSKRARRVLDVDRIYLMVTEALICTKCKCTHLSSSQAVLMQLDLAHRAQFRVILTEK